MEVVPDRNPELLVSVSDPLKHIDPIKDYVSYNLATRTSFSSFPSTDLAVRRRYKDFLEFRQQLVALYPGLVIPPLPEKMSTKYLDRFSDAFLEKRRRALEQFMTRLTLHPELSQSEYLRHFLSEETWSRSEEEKPGSSGAWMKMSLGTRTKSKDDPEGNSFENLKNYFIEFHKTLSSIHGLLRSVCQKHFELSEQYSSLGESFMTLSDQPERTLTEAIRTLGQVYAQNQSALLNEAATQLDYNTVEAIKEYVLIGQTALTVLKYRDSPLSSYLSALSDLTNTKAELLRLQKQQEDPTQKRSSFSSLLGLSDDPQAKLNRLQEKVQTEELKLSQTRDTLDNISRSLIAEMERLHQYKLKDLRNLLIEFVSGQIDLHKKSADNWETTLTTISNISLMEISANLASGQNTDSFGFSSTNNNKKENVESSTEYSSPYSNHSNNNTTHTNNQSSSSNNYTNPFLGETQDTPDFFSSSSSSSSFAKETSSSHDPFTSPFTAPVVSSDPFADPFADPPSSAPPPVPATESSSTTSPFAPYEDEVSSTSTPVESS